MLFKGSHAYDCAYAPGGFPQVNTQTGWVPHHLLDQSRADGTLGHFTPDTSSINGLGPRAMATDGSQLFLGGDFALVNGKAQQGFAIFPTGVGPRGPAQPSSAPTVTSALAGVDSVSFPAVSSRDGRGLQHRLPGGRACAAQPRLPLAPHGNRRIHQLSRRLDHGEIPP